MANGLAGTTLRIDLTDQDIQRLKTDEQFMRQWYGGRGAVSKIIYDEVPRDADPLGEQNVLVVSAGILSGCFIPGGSKVEFGSISPLTNILGDSNMGGHFGPALKFAGYDLLIIRGISKQPVYLYIDNDVVELRDASKYWGMGSLDCESLLKQDLGDDFEIATVGPAAENGILFSCISHDYGRQAGRTGQGAVMGSKRLKAIVVRGDRSIHVHDLASLSKHVMRIIDRTKKHPNMIPWQKYGTSF
ncbi:MAG: aldehyde ferredoxin oxidoreductase N-terminal domain-containing protein, partial [Syntrophales bacterium]